eukprot:scaffold74254_cov53-Phaeocystis_antarctica.AAC.3
MRPRAARGFGGRACSRRTPPALRTSAAAAGQVASCLDSLTAAVCAERDCGPARSLAHSWETLRASTGSSGLAMARGIQEARRRWGRKRPRDAEISRCSRADGALIAALVPGVFAPPETSARDDARVIQLRPSKATSSPTHRQCCTAPSSPLRSSAPPPRSPCRARHD